MLLNDKVKAPKEKVFTVENKISLDPSEPIPISYGQDSFSVIRTKKFIPFLGKEKNLPTLLLEARMTSVTQNACITSIASSVIGNGVIIQDQENPDQDLLNWMKSVNNDLDSLDEVLLGSVEGERGQGNQFIEVVKGKLGKVPFLKLYLHPFQYCRYKKPDQEGVGPSEVIISKLFAKKGSILSYDDAVTIPLWSPNKIDQGKCWMKAKDGTLRTMLHLKNTVSGVDYYGLPASIASLRYQVLEGKSAQYNLDNFENNMVLGGMLMFKSAMTPDEAVENAERIMLSHIGAGKTGRIAVISSETGLDDVKYEEYKTQKEGSYIEFDKRLEEKIIMANNWDGVFFGVGKGHSMGTGTSYIRSVWDAKEAALLNPLRRKLLDKVLSPIMQIYADVFNKKEILQYKLWFNSAMPFSFLGDIDPAQFMQVNEARELANLESDDKKKGVYLGEMTKVKTTPTPNPNPDPAANV